MCGAPRVRWRATKRRQQNALSEQKRYESLVKAGVVSTQEYDRVASNAAALEAAVRADKGALENAKVQLVYASIYSPINGRTGNLLVHQGNMIKANDVPSLVNINQVEPIYVTFTVPQQYLADVKQYSRNGNSAGAGGDPERCAQARLTGKLSFHRQHGGFDNGHHQVEGRVRQRDRRLWPGQFVDAYLTLKTQSNALVIPSQAIQNGQQGTFVYVIKDDDTVEARSGHDQRNAASRACRWCRRGWRPASGSSPTDSCGWCRAARVQVKQQSAFSAQHSVRQSELADC